jgi:hypothetical protein
VSLEVHVVVRLTTAPVVSLNVAVKATVWPLALVMDAGDTTTLPMGAGVTVSAALPDFPPLLAVIVALPVLMALTLPAAVTVATAVLLDDHVTTRSVTTVPLASFTTAARAVVRPASSSSDDG